MPYRDVKAVGSNQCWGKILLHVTWDKIQPAVKISAAAGLQPEGRGSGNLLAMGQGPHRSASRASVQCLARDHRGEFPAIW